MSKIYEALLRAEQERADAQAANPTPLNPAALLEHAPPPQPEQPIPTLSLDAPRTPPASTLAEVFLQTTSHAAPETPPSLLSPDLFRPDLLRPDLHSPDLRSSDHHSPDLTNPPLAYPAARPLGDDIFDPARVPQYKWEPRFSHLPALDERGKAVEQFRSLRSRMFEFRDLNKLKSIIVCSGLPKEGKSFVTANLAISFALHLANRVLLIDGDMRRSTLHHLLGAPGDVGLSEYLAGSANIMEIVQRAEPTHSGRPVPQGLTSLTFIPAGRESDKAADLSGNRRFDELIRKLSPHFDWIVVDSSPVNLVADGVNLARACDGVLLVARGGVTRFQSAQRALSELKASNLLGFVLNAVEKPMNTAGYYGYEEYDADRTEKLEQDNQTAAQETSAKPEDSKSEKTEAELTAK